MIKRFILLAIAVILFAPAAYADCTESQYYLSNDGSVLVVKLSCTGSAVDGSVADTDVDASAVSAGLKKTYQYMGFYLWEFWTVAGGTSPDAADVTITDALGGELYSEVGVITAAGTKAGTVSMPAKAVTSTLTVSVANQDTANATWDMYIKMVR